MDSFDESDTESGTSEEKSGKKNKNKKKKVVVQPVRRPSVLAAPGRHHYGSFYLRMGAVGKLFIFLSLFLLLLGVCVETYAQNIIIASICLYKISLYFKQHLELAA